jgi:hypothetical protein
MAIRTRIPSILLNPYVGILLILAFGIPRFILVLRASITGNYQWVSILFVIMAILPWLLLKKNGRKAIGITKPEHPTRIIQFFILGVFACALVFFIGRWLFFDSFNNWFVYLSKDYTIGSDTDMENNRLTYFVVFSLIGITFSPIGEEIEK